MKSTIYSGYVANCIHPRWLCRTCGVVLLLLALTLSGCLSRPAVNKQTFAFSAPELTNSNDAANAGVLAIKTLQIDPPFDTRSFVYRTGEFSYQRDPYAELLGPPDQELVALAGGTLREEAGFSSVVKVGDFVKPNTLVEINISQLYGDIRDPKHAYAVLAMQVIFLEATNGLSGHVLLQKNYSRRIPMESATAPALMAGWNQALAEILAETAANFRNRKIQ